MRSKRKTRCRLLLNRFTAEKVKNIIFTDEKDFTLEVARNRQNDRVYGKRKRDIAPNRLYHETSRFTKNVMVSAVVSWKGKTRIHFIDTERTKVNTAGDRITARLSPVIPQWRLGISTGWSSSSHEQDHSGIS